MRRVYREELTPVNLLERAGAVHADRPAVVDGEACYTFAEWRGPAPRARPTLSLARRLATALRLAGLQKGDRVAFLALNSEPLLLAHFGVLQAGGVLVAINTRLNPGEVAYIVGHSESRMVFCSRELAAQVTTVPDSVERVELGTEFEAFLASGSPGPVKSWTGHEYELCAIDYTSGTTGRPKGVMYHHRGAYLNAVAL